ncbi:MAG: molybdopterin-dependent oxidoreductase [Nitrospinae bacterium]|nr:molybdopterin-dependent oxidoreductase [Nitrospinota bacterium]
MCNAGCGIMVRTVMGRAKKVEGNPAHPVNGGGVCALGQAAVHQLYHPERLKLPLLRSGPRGTNAFKEVSWPDALARLADNMKKAEGGASYAVVSNPHDAVTVIASKTLKKMGSDNLAVQGLSAVEGRRLAAASALHFPDMAKAGCVLMLGSDVFAGEAAAHYGDRFGRMRRGNESKRGMMIYAGTRLSLTAASADRFVAAKEGSLGVLALAVAREYVSLLKGRGTVNPKTAAWEKALAGNADASSKTGVPEDAIKKIARDLYEHGPSAVIAGDDLTAHTNGAQALAAADFLNSILRETADDKDGVWPPAEKLSGYETIRKSTGVPEKFAPLGPLLASAANGKMKLGLIIDSDPVQALPAGLNARKALEATGFVAVFGCFLNDTTRYADLVLPDHQFLEAWSAQAAVTPHGTPFFNAQQPVVRPLYGTMQSGDAILKAATMAGFGIGVDTQEALLLGMVGDLRRNLEGVPPALDGKKAWEHVLQRGFAVASAKPSSAPGGSAKNPEAPRVDDPLFTGLAPDDFFLHPYTAANIGDGRVSNISWLLEMPEPMTSVKWGSWVEINPKTAARLGIADGDVLKVETKFGSAEAPACIYPGIGPDTIAMPVGFGHLDFGKHARGRGANVMSIVGDVEGKGFDYTAFRSVKATVTKTGKRMELIREGNPKGDYEGEVFQL